MARSGLLRMLLFFAVSSFILTFILPYCIVDAKIGYSVNVDVDGTKWGRSKYTEVMNFKSESECSGKGNSSKYVNVPGFSGIGFKEITYTKEGRLATKNALNLTAKFNWVYITEDVDGAEFVNETDEKNGSINVVQIAKDNYYAEINESMPTLVRTDDEIQYIGEGIYTRNSYSNNEDKICTSYQATNLSKAARYVGAFSNAVVKAHVAKDIVDVDVLSSTATSFRVLSYSDRYSRLKFKSGNAYSDEEYVGNFKISRTISKRSRFNLTKEEAQWLGCCSPEADFAKPKWWNCDCIFDAHNPTPYFMK